MKNQNQLIIAVLIIGGIFLLAKQFSFLGSVLPEEIVWDSSNEGSGLAAYPSISGNCQDSDAKASIISTNIDLKTIETTAIQISIATMGSASAGLYITDGTKSNPIQEAPFDGETKLVISGVGLLVYLENGQAVGLGLDKEKPWNLKLEGSCIQSEGSSFEATITNLNFNYERICEESDGGQNYELVGQVFINGLLAATDACTATSGQGEVLEYGCTTDNNLDKTNYHPCEYGCMAGACLVSESCCIENWHCTDWSNCLTMPSRPDEPSVSVRTRKCTDINGCGAIVNRPINIQKCDGDCVPYTCADMNYNCGIVSDGCGGTLDCGTCASGECLNNMCKFTCSETNCGIIESACGNPLDCGNCEEGYECTSNVCTVIPTPTPAPSGGGGYRWECYSDDYCQSGQICVDYECVAGAPTCKEGEVLNITTNKCTEVIIQQKSSWWWLIVLIAIIVYYKKRKK